MEKELGEKGKVTLASENAAALFHELLYLFWLGIELKNVLCIFHSVVYRHQRNTLSFSSLFTHKNNAICGACKTLLLKNLSSLIY